MSFAIRRVVLALNECWSLTPDSAISFTPAEQVLLVVGWAKDVVTHKAQNKNTCSLRCTEMDWVVDQEQPLSKKPKGSTILITIEKLLCLPLPSRRDWPQRQDGLSLHYRTSTFYIVISRFTYVNTLIFLNVSSYCIQLIHGGRLYMEMQLFSSIRGTLVETVMSQMQLQKDVPVAILLTYCCYCSYIHIYIWRHVVRLPFG